MERKTTYRKNPEFEIRKYRNSTESESLISISIGLSYLQNNFYFIKIEYCKGFGYFKRILEHIRPIPRPLPLREGEETFSGVKKMLFWEEYKRW